MNNLLNFKSFLKFLGRNKAYTLIDVFGLSVSLMFVLLIAVYTVQEMSTDKFHTKADRIYLVGNENWMATGAAIPYKIKERYPEVEKVCPVVADNSSNIVVVSGDRKLKANVMFADSTFFDFFDFRLLQGTREQALAAGNYAVVSSSFARKMFGTDDPMGRQLVVGDTISATINGVVEDLLHSSIPEADVIVRWEQVRYLNWSLAPDQLGNAGSTSAFVLVREGSDFPSRAEDMAHWFKEFYWPYQYGTAKEVRILPLSEQYFAKAASYSSLRKGDWRFVIVLMSVGFLILIFAVINYINLTVAQAGFRAKEMATRRLLGSSRGELFMRLMLESTLLTFISLVIGVLLALAVVPFVNDLLQTHVYMSVLGSPVWLLALVSLTVVVGVLSGLLPAIIISSSKPIEVVRGTFRAKTKMVFSKFFIVFQNVITITMIAASIVMVSQIVHMINAPVGYCFLLRRHFILYYRFFLYRHFTLHRCFFLYRHFTLHRCFFLYRHFTLHRCFFLYLRFFTPQWFCRHPVHRKSCHACHKNQYFPPYFAFIFSVHIFVHTFFPHFVFVCPGFQKSNPSEKPPAQSLLQSAASASGTLPPVFHFP